MARGRETGCGDIRRVQSIDKELTLEEQIGRCARERNGANIVEQIDCAARNRHGWRGTVTVPLSRAGWES